MIANLVKEHRVASGLSIEEMAKRCNMSPYRYQSIEDGDTEPFSHEEKIINRECGKLWDALERKHKWEAKQRTTALPASQREGGVR